MANKMLIGYNFGRLTIAVIPQEQKKADKEDWREIDPDSLPDELSALYDDYKEWYKLAQETKEMVAAKEAKAAFETAMREQAGLATAAKAKASNKAVSLSDFLASQANAGRQA